MSLPKLIITADDYGMSPRFNAGIHELATTGILTGISVMIKREHIEPTILLALGIPLGLHLELEEIVPYEELVRQIELFKEQLGVFPTYLDGHQHKHITPQNLPLVVRAAKHYHLPVRSRLAEDRSVLKSQTIYTNDNFISWHPHRIATLKSRLREAENFLVNEMVTHPGHYDTACSYPYNQERERELAFLMSPECHDLIKGFELVHYTESM